MNEIIFKEGGYHQVIIAVPSGVTTSGSSASIQVRNRPTGALKFKFTSLSGGTSGGTLNISGNNIVLGIPSNISIGKADKYKWQLKIWTNDSDAIEFDIFDFIIEPSVNV
jgi:hypothetical protein